MALAPAEVALCARIARLRDESHRGHRDSAGFNVPWAHMVGATTEYAASKLLGLEWTMPYHDDMAMVRRIVGDVGPYQIRGTRFTRANCLNIRLTDTKPEAVFVMATWEERTATVRLHGWMVCKDAKVQRFYRATHENKGKPYWAVPERLVHPMATLPHVPCPPRP